MEAPTEYKPRWERRKDARPQELLGAALDLFVERGYAATRLEDVARRAGVSKGTLYLYFTNKEELFKAMVRETIVPGLGEAEHSIATFDGPSGELLRTILCSWWQRYGSTRLAGVTKLMMAEAGNFPELSRFYNDEVIARANAMIARILERGMASGEFRPVDTETMTLILTAPMVMLTLWTQALLPCKGGPLDAAVFLDAFIEQSVRGLRADGPGAAA